jgi:hypothetical protein
MTFMTEPEGQIDSQANEAAGGAAIPTLKMVGLADRGGILFLSHLLGKMLCLFRYSAVLAIINIVVAQIFDPITSPSQDQNLVAGSSVDIAWTYSSVYAGALTITLVLGPTTTNLSLGSVIAGLTRIHPKEN